MLVVYNFGNGATYYYDSVSAELLYALLKKDEKQVRLLIDKYDISSEVYQSFIQECETLFNTNCIPLYKDGNEELIDNSTIISQVQNDLYKQNILYRFHIDITHKCNLRCIHCYHPFEKYERDTMSFDEIKRLFSVLYDMGVFLITISGGEPFLRKDIVDILEEGGKYGFVFQILTNATLLNEDDIKRLSQLNVSKLSFSYYGNDDAQTKITGNKKFREHLMTVVKWCEKYNLAYELKFILLKLNIGDFDDYVELCKELRVKPLFEPCLIPKLNGDKSNFESKLDFETYKRFMKEHVHYFYDGIDMAQYAEKVINCSAGRYGLYCDFKGDVFPCVSYREPLGTYTDIKNIWNKSEKLLKLRDRKHNQFKTFNKYSFCKYCYQICPGLSLCENGDSLECKNSGCLVAEVIESVKNEENF